MVSEESPSARVLALARAAVDAGEPWRARDLLEAHVETERDTEAFALLAEVHHGMGDLPRAGTIWFAAGAMGPQADAAVAAWREQSHDDFAVMWSSLPASVRVEPMPRRIQALRERARAAGADVDHDAPATASGTTSATSPVGGSARDEVATRREDVGEDEESQGGFDASWLVAWVLAVAFVVFAVIGFVTALGWIVPG